MLKLEHIGIAVEDLTQSEKLFSRLLNTEPYKKEEVQSESVTTSFYQSGESKIELLASNTSDSAIAKYLSKKGEGVHHLAFLVEDIQAEIERMKSEGFQPISEKPKKGADNKLVFFFHPKSTNGVLIEICQNID